MEYNRREIEYLKRNILNYEKKRKKGDFKAYLLEKMYFTDTFTMIEFKSWLKEGYTKKNFSKKLPQHPEKWISKCTSFGNLNNPTSNVGRILERIGTGKFKVLDQFKNLYYEILNESGLLKKKKVKAAEINENELANSIFKNYYLLKDDFDLVDFNELLKIICNELNISEEILKDYIKILNEKDIINYSIVPGREIQRIKIIEGSNYEKIKI